MKGRGHLCLVRVPGVGGLENERYLMKIKGCTINPCKGDVKIVRVCCRAGNITAPSICNNIPLRGKGTLHALGHPGDCKMPSGILGFG